LDLGGVLVGDEPAAHLRHRPGRQHRLGALARVAAQQTVHLAGGARPELLEHGEAALAAERAGTPLLDAPLLLERQSSHLLSYVRRPLANRVVEAGDRDTA